MRLARALCLCIAAQRHRSTRGSQGQLPSKTQHEHVDATHICDECKVQIDEAVFLRLLLLA
jgi:hypothetical protein